MDRRHFLATTATGVIGATGVIDATNIWSQDATHTSRHRKKIAALSTTYHVRSHSDNFITRFLEGYWINEKYFASPCDVASLYVEQEHAADISQRLAGSWGVSKYPNIQKALTLGGKELAVDGVLLIGEHGNYPTNVKNQKLYPRHRYMQEIVDVFRRSGRAVPVFNDKHLSYDWQQSKQMYDWSKELQFPLMAGSSVSVTFRRPALDFPLETQLEEAVAVGGGWVSDGGLFHLLETLQCFAERRAGGETGIKAVQLLTDDAVWQAADRGFFNLDLVEAALSRGQQVTPGPLQQKTEQPVACLIEYRDGFRGAALGLGGKANEYLAAVKIQGEHQPRSTLCYIPIENSNNFSPLVDSIGRMFTDHTLDYPVERTLLTSGALSFLMESWYQGQVRIETPMLDISYRAPAKSYCAPGEGS